MSYKIEATDPVSNVQLNNLIDKPFAIEDDEDDSIIIYFENEGNRDQFIEDNTEFPLTHYRDHIGDPHR